MQSFNILTIDGLKQDIYYTSNNINKKKQEINDFQIEYRQLMKDRKKFKKIMEVLLGIEEGKKKIEVENEEENEEENENFEEENNNEENNDEEENNNENNKEVNNKENENNESIENNENNENNENHI